MCRGRGIGYYNSLPCILKSDFKNFEKLTIGNGNNIVVIGHKTSRAKPTFENRNNLILTKNDLYNQCPPYFNSINNILDYKKNTHYENIWIVGGASIFNSMLTHPKLEHIYITEIDTICKYTHFLDEIPPWFYLDSTSKWFKENNISYRFKIYSKNSNFLDYVPKSFSIPYTDFLRHVLRNP